MRAALVFAPIVLLAAFVAVRAVSGRPLSRRALDIAVALMLLGYLFATAALGLFWVARMDLPVFDWHYLFGYALLVVAATHVSLQLRGLVRFFRPRAQQAATQPARASRTARLSPGAVTALAGALTVVAVGALLWRASPDQTRRSELPPARPDAAEPGTADGPRIVSHLYAESRYSRAGVIRAVAPAPPRPSETKPYAGQPRRKLPVAARQAGVGLSTALLAFREPSAHAPLRTLSIDSVSTLLFHANGVTAAGPGYAFRAAASSGALYPTDVYILSRDVPGLEPGAYYYDGPSHELVRVADARAVANADAALPDAFPLADAPLLVVLGATFDRTAWKYTTRTYRYLGLDAGHVALNLVAAATVLGIPCVPLPVFDDQKLGAALGLDSDEEAPLLALACGGSRGPSHPPISPRHRATSLPADGDEWELTRLSSSVTAWSLLPGFTWLRATAAPRPPSGQALPQGRGSERDLFELIRARRSFRDFEIDAVSREAMASVLSEATSVFGWLRGTPLVELFVAVRAVEGIEPGTYRYDPARRALSEPLARGAPAIERAGLDQALLGQAAFVLAWALVDERAGHLEGARDFRHACLEAGLAGEVAYLSASAGSLGICGVGAFYDDEVGKLFASAGQAPRVVYLMGVGAR